MSLSKLKHWMFGNVEESNCGECTACTACQHVEHGSVNMHTIHVLLRIRGRPAYSSWPEKIEDLPVVESLSSALKDNGLAGVKITLFDYVGNQNPPQSLKTGEPGTCDILLFPACVRLEAVPSPDVNDAVIQALCSKEKNQSQNYLIVCCHAARDARCGYLGPKLADALSQRLGVKNAEQQRDGEDKCKSEVIMSSHVGGHKFAGNVIVYGKRFPGVWFGGLSAEVAHQFLDRLLSLEETNINAAEDEFLSRYWRGQTGLSKEEQLALYNRFRLENQQIENIAS
jgi:hypothetical protein